MKVLSISKRKFEHLNKVKLSNNILNTEAVMFDIKYKGEDKILKALYNTDGEVFANKLYTVEMLDSYRNYLPESFVIPDSLCIVSGEIKGFTLPKINAINLSTILNDIDIPLDEKLFYLKKIGEILEQLEHIRKYTNLTDLYINDLHESNFIVDNNNKELKVVDLDSCKIASNSVFPSRFLNRKSLVKYSSKYKINEDDCMGHIIPSNNTDLFCYNMVLLNFLSKNNVVYYNINEFYDYLNYLELVGFNKNLINCFSKIISDGCNENPIDYIDSITYDNYVKANNNVYLKNKKRVLKR